MFKWIDRFLNQITMYRLVLYYLVFLILAAAGLGLFGMLPYGPISITVSTIFITVICWLANNFLAKVFRVPANVESVYITALILALIITPLRSFFDLGFYSLAFWASLWAMASKYIIAIRKKHIFNPAAFAVALTALTINQSASWWVGTLWMAPFVLVGGYLIVRKILRHDLVFSFLVVAVVVIAASHYSVGVNIITLLSKVLFDTPILFFALVMLTEPLTTPPTQRLQIYYGALVGVLFSPAIHVGAIYSTPELALLVGNIFAYAVSSKAKLLLTLQQMIPLSSDSCDFIFLPDRPLKFKPGQYLEWTLGHTSPDNRGNRRYFTIASSPTEKEIRLGVKFYPNASSFKKSLIRLEPGETIIASQLAGDFVMPKDTNKKLVFIAGGIGITPFRSMIKYLLDTNERRSITLLYSNRSMEEILYRDVFDQAAKQLNVKTVYTITDTASVPANWHGHVGRVDAEMIAQEIPDYRDSLFYISGPHAMVAAFDDVLRNLGIPTTQIIKDFFPGFA